MSQELSDAAGERRKMELGGERTLEAEGRREWAIDVGRTGENGTVER